MRHCPIRFIADSPCQPRKTQSQDGPITTSPYPGDHAPHSHMVNACQPRKTHYLPDICLSANRRSPIDPYCRRSVPLATSLCCQFDTGRLPFHSLVHLRLPFDTPPTLSADTLVGRNNPLIPSAGLLRYFTWLPGIENSLIRHSWIIKALLLEGKEKVPHKLDFLFTELYPLRSFTYDFPGENPLDYRF